MRGFVMGYSPKGPMGRLGGSGPRKRSAGLGAVGPAVGPTRKGRREALKWASSSRGGGAATWSGSGDGGAL